MNSAQVGGLVSEGPDVLRAIGLPEASVGKLPKQTETSAK